MNWIKVKSSHVAEVAYDDDIRVLAVRYCDGSVYIRPNIPAGMFGEIVSDPSIGKMIGALPWQSIRVERGTR